MLDPRLARLRTELERLGSVVVPHGEHICVRLPLAASVVIRVENGVLHCEPQLGPFGRSSALAGTAVATTAGVGVLVATGGLALPIAVAVGGVSTMLVQLGAFMLADNALARIHTLWMRMLDAEGDPRLGARTDSRALHAPLPDEMEGVARASERRA